VPEHAHKKVIRVAAGSTRDGRRGHHGDAHVSAHRRPNLVTATQAPRTAPLDVGDIVSDRYELSALIDEGGSSFVYRATDQVLDMEVALKFLPPQLNDDPSTIQALKSEARIALGLSHENIVRLYNLEKQSAGYFLVMEFIDGQSVRQHFRSVGAFDAQTTAQILACCASALGYAHAQGVFHNDLKPDNLLLRGDGVLKIIDFGTACLGGIQFGRDYITGTPAYMSPEQKRGDLVDHRTDVYALGIIAYELLTGHVPYPPEATPMDIMDLEPGELSGLTAGVQSVLQTAIATNMLERYQSVSEFSAAVNQATAQSHF